MVTKPTREKNMSAKGQLLQDPFLNTLRKEHVPVSIYLVNGIKLQGQIESFDQYVVLLRNSVTQMVYKHAISTVVPARAVSLDRGGPAPEDAAEELLRLAESAGVRRHAEVRGRRQRPDPKFFVGSGKVEEISRAARGLNAATVIFNHALSPAQQRNLEQALERQVLDRTELILTIFAQRAQTHEGKLQVELARLQHLATRLVRGWTHLERQRGGLGKTGGPGEKQIELDRPMLPG